MDINQIAKITAVGLGAYIFGQILLFKPSVDAWSYWEAQGYINGLVRGAGSSDNALNQLNAWRDYWIAQRGWASSIINHFYNYGLQRIDFLYGSLGAGMIPRGAIVHGSLVD